MDPLSINISHISEDFSPNPPNSSICPIHEILPPPSIHYPKTCMNIQCILSSEAPYSPPISHLTTKGKNECPPSSSTPSIDENAIINSTHTSDTTMSRLLAHTSDDPSFSFIFQYNEHILESMTTPHFPWDSMHHWSFFLEKGSFQPCIDTHVYTIETKDFIPRWHVDWFKL